MGNGLPHQSADWFAMTCVVQSRFAMTDNARENAGEPHDPLVGVDALIDPTQNPSSAYRRDDVGIVPYSVLSEVLGHLRGIATPVTSVTGSQ